MAKQSPRTYPFSEPWENYTKNPNVYCDEYMRRLTPAENLVFQQTVRKTWGWQKAFAAISIPQFMDITGIRSKNTVKTAIEGLVKKRFIFKYETIDPESKHRKTYYWINTEKNARIYHAVVSGRLTIQEAFELTSAHIEGTPKVIHIDQEIEGSNADPRDGSKFDPSCQRPQGSRTDPHKKKKSKEKGKKDGDSPFKNVDKPSEAEANAIERLQEQRLTRNRRTKQADNTVSSMGELAGHLLDSCEPYDPNADSNASADSSSR